MKLYEVLNEKIRNNNNQDKPYLAQDARKALAAFSEKASDLEVILNSVMNPYSGSGSCGDFGNARNSTVIPDFVYGSEFKGEYRKEVERMYYGVGEAKRIIDLPIQDVLRDKFLFDGLENDDIDRVNNYLDKLNFHELLERALISERLYGGSALFIGVKDYKDDPSIPINYNTLSIGDLSYLNVINRWDITNVDIENDPTKPDYQRPTHYYIQGKRIARNRLLIFDGQPLSPHRGMNGGIWNIKDGFGFPILLRLKGDIERAVGVREAAYHLAQRASVMVFKGDVGTAAAFKDSNKVLSDLQRIMQLLSNYKAAILDNSPTSQSDLMTLTANFGAIPELITTYLQILGAQVDMPATIMLGESPGGLNATGESQLSLWEKNILGIQRRLKPELNKLLPVLLPSAGVFVSASKVFFEFSPLWEVNEKEAAEIRTLDIDNVYKLVDAQIYTRAEAAEELKVRESIKVEPKDIVNEELDFSGELEPEGNANVGQRDLFAEDGEDALQDNIRQETKEI